MQAANTLQNALRKGGSTFGAWQMLPGTNLSRTLARSGPDWICVDTEHGNISDDHMHECVAAIAACGVSPVVRVAANETWMVKRALDAGAHGIIVPLIYTVEDAVKAVSSAKFPPEGTRGYGSPFSAEKFNYSSSSATTSGVDYLKQANSSLVTVLQIETKEALANVDAIASVPGVDVLLVGPFDLGNNIGLPVLADGTMSDGLKDAIETVLAAATKADKSAGIFCTSGEQSREYADKGFHMISAFTDAPGLAAAAASTFQKAKGGWGHAAFQGVKQGVTKITGASEK